MLGGVRYHRQTGISFRVEELFCRGYQAICSSSRELVVTHGPGPKTLTGATAHDQSKAEFLKFRGRDDCARHVPCARQFSCREECADFLSSLFNLHYSCPRASQILTLAPAEYEIEYLFLSVHVRVRRWRTPRLGQHVGLVVGSMASITHWPTGESSKQE